MKKTLAILCSGGDGPGMNSVIRSFVRSAISYGHEVYGIQRGFYGLYNEHFTRKMDLSSVGNIISLGGTCLHTSRFPDFQKAQIRHECYSILKNHGIEGLVVIGGNGSFNGAYEFAIEFKFPTITIPASIDNDIEGSEYSIGFDTAVNTALESIDKIRDTASSHERIFLIEIMGKSSPELALKVGLSSGAENIVFDPHHPNIKELVQSIEEGRKRGKSFALIVVAEGERPGMSYSIQEQLLKDHQIPSHVCVLGHIQRGGSPTAHDRYIGAQMGFLAAREFHEKFDRPKAIVVENGKVKTQELSLCLKKRNSIDQDFLDILKTLAK